MSIESTKKESIVPSQRERFEAILEKIRMAPAAENAHGAHILVTQAFQDVERPLRMRGAIKHSMVTGNFSEMKGLRINQKRVLFELHIKHILFLGENGAIDIRRNDEDNRVTAETLRADPSRATDLTVTFSKPGADGHEIFEN